MSNIYLALGDFRAAESEGRQSIALLEQAPQKERLTRDFLIRAVNLVAYLCSIQGKAGESEIFFQQAISLSQKQGDKVLEADLWDDRGLAQLRRHDLAAAERSLKLAFDLRRAAARSRKPSI